MQNNSLRWARKQRSRKPSSLRTTGPICFQTEVEAQGQQSRMSSWFGPRRIVALSLHGFAKSHDGLAGVLQTPFQADHVQAVTTSPIERCQFGMNRQQKVAISDSHHFVAHRPSDLANANR